MSDPKVTVAVVEAATVVTAVVLTYVVDAAIDK